MSLEILQQHAAKARDLELEIQDLSSQIHEKNDQLKVLYNETMPNLLDALKLDRIGIAPDGNKPGADFKMASYYSANIAASWDDDRKELGFALLEKLKAGDLIKAEVTSRLPKGSLKVAKQLVAAAKKLGVTAVLKKSVHNQTLSAWLRELYEDRHQSLPQSELEKIGASVGRKVVPEERK